MARSSSESNINKQLISLQPDALIELFEIDFSNMQENFEQLKDLYGINVGADTVYRFCSSINSTNPIVWRGQSYQPMPVRADGFEHKNDGRFPRPKLIISNPEGIFSRIIYNNSDFVGCKVTRKRTYLRFLDDENFQNKNLNSSGQNPFGTADQEAFLPDDVYYINKKISEDQSAIVFELSSSLELQNAFLPGRQMYGDLCTWTYRCEIGCGYKGLAIETMEEQDLTSGFAFNQNANNPGYVDPNAFAGGEIDVPEWSKYGRNGSSSSPTGYKLNDVVKTIAKTSSNPYKRAPQVFVCIQDHLDPVAHHPFFDKEHWLKDDCSKSLRACKKRFDKQSDLLSYNKSDKVGLGIPFGGFPGISQFSDAG